MTESLVGVDLGEASVEDGNTDAGAVDTLLTEELSLHAEQLVGEGGVI